MKKILIVDDDESFAQMLSTHLKHAEYQVFIAHDRIQGIKTMLAEKPDLILLDIGLPGGDGFLVAEKARELPEKISIIYVTISDDPDDRKKAMELGAAGYFKKPFHFKELHKSIKSVLGE